MSYLKVRPTRMELINLRRRLRLVERAKDLLKDKENALVTEFLRALREYLAVKEELREALEKLRTYVGLAEIESSSLNLEEIVLLRGEAYRLEAYVRNVMGVKVPSFKLSKVEEVKVSRNLISLPLYVAKLVKEGDRMLNALISLLSLELELRELALEIFKTRRRANALEYVISPELKKVIKEIEMTLEEREREDIYRLRRVLSLGPSVP
ncbi:MAG: V-type ATP synthase subunit D [Thermofilum sp. ex4484_15]|nr:MAG: V-type ATP synthase subunit D [Thermofilum sp. ex4484_15]